MKAARAAWKRSARESSHLRSLLATKDNTIASLISDYKQIYFAGAYASGDVQEARHVRR
ncbi:hypothetical protein E2C01_098014 [Portunus trituberculatus]|uniref:Uncharacterized protein n=1 Tax=Portunus trituberculatus TaxID=210409 RepID=A0A5B7K048_PORTR|nr:hypothetical protein [Portunus trituberculatus]